MASSAPTKFDSSRVVSRTFDAIGANFVAYALLAVILSGVVNFLVKLWYQSQLDTSDPAAMFATGFGWAFAVVILVAIVTNALLSAGVTRATVQHLSGEKSDFAQALGTSLQFVVPLIIIGILQGLGIMLGLILLIVPGIILALAWSVVVPAFVTEKTGLTGAFGRSYELTKDNWLNLFVLFLVTGIVIGIIGWIIGIIATMIGGGNLYITLTINSIWELLTTIFYVTMGASVYVELRNVKEGIEPNRLQDIFA